MGKHGLIIRGVVLILIGVIFLIFNIYSLKGDDNDNKNNSYKIQLIVNEEVMDVELEDNKSVKAFVEKVKENDLVINAHDYGNFEKVGDLGFNIPTTDRNMRTEAGDIILYQGNQITLYYDTNSWSLTKLGHVNKTKEELKNLLGNGDVTLTFKYIAIEE